MRHSKSEIAVKRGVSATILIWLYNYMHHVGFESLSFSHSWELFYSFVALLAGDPFLIFCTVLHRSLMKIRETRGTNFVI